MVGTYITFHDKYNYSWPFKKISFFQIFYYPCNKDGRGFLINYSFFATFNGYLFWATENSLFLIVSLLLLVFSMIFFICRLSQKISLTTLYGYVI